MPLHDLIGVAVVLATLITGITAGRILGTWLGNLRTTRRNRRRNAAAHIRPVAPGSASVYRVPGHDSSSS